MKKLLLLLTFCSLSIFASEVTIDCGETWFNGVNNPYVLKYRFKSTNGKFSGILNESNWSMCSRLQDGIDDECWKVYDANITAKTLKNGQIEISHKNFRSHNVSEEVVELRLDIYESAGQLFLAESYIYEIGNPSGGRYTCVKY